MLFGVGRRIRRRMVRQTSSLVVYVINGLILIIVSLVVFSFKSLWWTIRWIKNYIHYRNIDFSYAELCRLINRMSGRQFEIFMAEIFKANDYDVEITQATNDGGKDLIIDGDTYVELKRWNGSHQVGRPELQKLVGAATGDKIENMLFITTGEYNANAFEYARKVENLTLWDMNNIMYLVNKTKVEKLPYIMCKVFSDDKESMLLNKVDRLNGKLES